MSVPGPVAPPCSAWISGDDVVACCSASTNPADFDDVAVQASMLLYELTARQFSGLCGPVKVRPSRQTCGCWGPQSLGVGPWFWTWLGGGGTGGEWGWRNECTEDRAGCGTTSYIKLAGYPVREIHEVKIDGVVLNPNQYKLERWRRLMRTTDPGPPPRTRLWPSCQDMALDDTQPGTISVTYSYGVDPPPLGRDAAAQLACELYSACHGGECKLPNKVVTVVRAGITMQRIVPLAAQLRAGATGLPLVDAFIAMVNPAGLLRRASVWSPDQQRFAKREAT